MRQITNISKQAVRSQIVGTSFLCASLNERQTHQGSLRTDFLSECFSTGPLRLFVDGICATDYLACGVHLSIVRWQRSPSRYTATTRPRGQKSGTKICSDASSKSRAQRERIPFLLRERGLAGLTNIGVRLRYDARTFEPRNAGYDTGTAARKKSGPGPFWAGTGA